MAIICKDYKKKTGGGGCTHMLEGGLCCVPQRMRCIEWLYRHQDQTSIQELLSHPEFGKIPVDLTVKNRQGGMTSIKAGDAMSFAKKLLENLQHEYSFSSLYHTYHHCPREFWLRYVKRIVPTKTAHALVIGSACHKVAELLAQGFTVDNSLKALDELAGQENLVASTGDEHIYTRIAGARAMMRAWCERRPGWSARTEIRVKHSLLPLIGYLDAIEDITNIGTVIGEHKFASSIEYKPIYRAQAMFYLGMTEADAVMLDVNLKPGLQKHAPKKGESLDDYETRMYELIKSKENEWSGNYLINRKDVEPYWDIFWANVTHLVARLEHFREKAWNLDYFECRYNECQTWWSKCDYLPLCSTGRIDPQFFTVETSGGRAGSETPSEE